ncbi:protein-export chaperone SecB [Acidimangrovimonas sediminis]|uniref:protein-export chaperone SecB n=1 Tax=Acidimangrovimonas sediminis TaxID=2056283 RepID=UPI000C808EDC|nr:protein-export chaperone SecB [Acidimangrovimonas sediminis]
MAENGVDPQAQEQQVRLQILAQYIRDLSFENVVAQKGFEGGEITPDIQVQVSLDARKRPVDDQYEVVMKFQITSKNEENQANLFLLEVEYGGIFLIQGVPEDQLHPFLLIECPRQLFPYVRRIVGDLTNDGGFPQLNLDNIDFVELYRQQMAAQQAEA